MTTLKEKVLKELGLQEGMTEYNEELLDTILTQRTYTLEEEDIISEYVEEFKHASELRDFEYDFDLELHQALLKDNHYNWDVQDTTNFINDSLVIYGGCDEDIEQAVFDFFITDIMGSEVSYKIEDYFDKTQFLEDIKYDYYAVRTSIALYLGH